MWERWYVREQMLRALAKCGLDGRGPVGERLFAPEHGHVFEHADGGGGTSAPVVAPGDRPARELAAEAGIVVAEATFAGGTGGDGGGDCSGV